MYSIIVFSQNLKLESFRKISLREKKENKIIFLTTHFLFENERKYLTELFFDVEFYTFADFLTDEEMEECDVSSFSSREMEYQTYLATLKKKKNAIVADKILEKYPDSNKLILSDDLGISIDIWRKRGFRYFKGEYYYDLNFKEKVGIVLENFGFLRHIYDAIRQNTKKSGNYNPEEVSVATYNGHKYVFIGKLNRIAYRLGINFTQSEFECNKLNNGKYETKDTCTYMTTWHEHGKCKIPDEDCYEVRWAQDGYLPPNYTHKDFCFRPDNVVYYCWDILGTQLFKNQGLPYEMIPFRKKLFLPEPIFPQKIENILIVASGSGDWTALKNRSDDDIMVDAFVKMAKRFPNIHFTYRCHPTWIHPLNVGVNSVNRVHKYFESMHLPNLTLSNNMPIANLEGNFQYSFSRSSLEEDLKKADFVFGEHSISMIDAAFKGIPFCSVNLTKRRNFFIGINKLGFPTVSSHDEIAKIIEEANSVAFKKIYLKAIENYNRMTDEDF